jgi:hypothetical protein
LRLFDLRELPAETTFYAQAAVDDAVIERRADAHMRPFQHTSVQLLLLACFLQLNAQITSTLSQLLWPIGDTSQKERYLEVLHL